MSCPRLRTYAGIHSWGTLKSPPYIFTKCGQYKPTVRRQNQTEHITAGRHWGVHQIGRNAHLTHHTFFYLIVQTQWHTNQSRYNILSEGNTDWLPKGISTLSTRYPFFPHSRNHDSQDELRSVKVCHLHNSGPAVEQQHTPDPR